MAAIAGFFFALRLATTLLCVRVFGLSPQAAAGAKLGLGFLLLFLVALTTLGGSDHGWRSILRPSSVRWVLVFLAFSASSLLWSETGSLATSLLYWCGTAADVTTVLLLLRSGNVEDTAASLMEGYICGGCLIALCGWLMPTQYDLRLGDEDYFNSNSICNVCVFAVVFAQYLMRTRQARWGVATLFLVLTILRSLSKSTITAFLVAEIYLVLSDNAMSRRTKKWLTIGAIAAALIFWGLFKAYYDFYTTNGNQAETLTGRTAIWTFAAAGVLESPWIGHGFDSMWNVVPAFGTFEARHAENELLEQLYSYGAVGLLVLCGVYGALFRNIRRMGSPASRVIWACMVVFVVVRGLAVADAFDLLLPVWTVTMTGLLVQAQRAGSESASPALRRATTPAAHALPTI
ncbi:O-antigen ligase [Acidipila sp. EB88]|uniref:O-antigen ligase family protein n=1 Tax=Acidipila sp. EB88 TaxID=2305226 RepID=UPI0013155C9F|nr:O-antigen ligase family protein [Acidipila sp. EB88]